MRPQEAQKALDEGIARMLSDPRPRMAGEAAQLYYKRGLARLLLKNPGAGEQDLKAALADPTGAAWVRGRVHTELGKLADLAGDRTRARAEYQAAIELGEKSGDPLGVDEAKRFLRTPYTTR